eukprot:PhM_4_TR13320/c0_g2_i2/m.72643/K04097/HPGDS; prostaglandin-H2 D-isomerase / glutathione transferase
MSKPTLVYFGVPGRGDPIRFTAWIGGVDFDNKVVGFPEFGGMQGTLPLGQLPVLKLPDGKTIGQSIAILRYVGRLAKMYPEDAVAAAEVDEVLYNVEELFTGIVPSMGTECPKARKTQRASFMSETVPWVLGALEKRLEANATGYFVGNALTVADINTVFFLQWMFESGFLSDVRCDIYGPYPKLSALRQTLLAHPVVVEKRKTEAPFFHIHRLYYFDLAGRAEATRMAFHAGGVPFDDVRLTQEEYAAFAVTDKDAVAAAE